MAKTKKKRISWEDRPPTLDIRGKNFFPEIKEMQIDDEVELVIRAKLSRKEEGSYDDMLIGCCDCDDDCGEDHEANRKKKQSASFRIVSIKSNGKVQDTSKMSPEARIAAKFNKNRKNGMSANQAMNSAKKG